MSLNALTEKVLALPTEQRFALAQELWESLDDEDLPGLTPDQLRDELQQRLRDEPGDDWKKHHEVMDQSRHEFGWKEK
jgi:putative addiction module component (TIGR02574 family)